MALEIAPRSRKVEMLRRFALSLILLGISSDLSLGLIQWTSPAQAGGSVEWDAPAAAEKVWRQTQAITPYLNRVPPVPSAIAGLLPDQSYRTRYGHILGSSCLRVSPQERIATGSKFDATLGNLLGGLQRCLRALPITRLHLSFYHQFAKPIRFECVPGGCTFPQALACARKTESLIQFQSKQPRMDEGLIFHEFLHLANMDNQDTATHNDYDHNGGENDEIYFWHHACFDTKFVLNALRSNPAACRNAIATSKVPRFRYNDLEVQLVCARLESFITFERAFKTRVERDLAPSVLGCGVEPRLS